MEYWEDSSDGPCAMPALPADTRVPPVILNVPSKSSVPLPSFVGPLTMTVPPDISIEPFASSPSPLALTSTYPPVMESRLFPALPEPGCPPPPVSESLLPLAAFTPSSEAVT
ncbi:hypothetical protein D3C71_1531260 [compost metagenome]